MLMHERVARKFIESAITFNSPSMSNPKIQQKEQDESVETLQEQNKELQEQVQKKEQEQKKLHGEMDKQKKRVTDIMHKNFKKAADDPNDDPNDLFRQVRPILSKMNIANISVNNKTMLMPGQTEDKNSLYAVLIRREAEITPDIIDRIKRNSKNLQKIKWSNAGIIFYVWYPYNAPGGEVPEEPVAP